jgi:hypothetical protein
MVRGSIQWVIAPVRGVEHVEVIGRQIAKLIAIHASGLVERNIMPYALNAQLKNRLRLVDLTRVEQPT